MKGNVLSSEEQFDELRNAVTKSFNKLRGRMDVTTAQGWIGNGPALDNFFEGLLPPAVVVVEPVVKFALLVDLSTIVVPEDYDHATWLTKFRERHQGGEKKSFYSYDRDISDSNFSKPSRVLKPGQRFQVCAYQQVVPGVTTSEERMEHLVAQGMTVYTGAQGASLVFDQKRGQLPKGKWYAAFDRAKRLWKDADGRPRVPNFYAHSDGVFDFDLGHLEYAWDGSYAFFGFRDLPAEVPTEAGAK